MDLHLPRGPRLLAYSVTYKSVSNLYESHSGGIAELGVVALWARPLNEPAVSHRGILMVLDLNENNTTAALGQFLPHHHPTPPRKLKLKARKEENCFGRGEAHNVHFPDLQAE